MATIFLALGANLGKRETTLRAAISKLRQEVLRNPVASPLYESAAVGGPAGQPPYLNAVLKAETELAPEELLARCLEIEAHFGRVRHRHWGPRTLDIDLLLYDRLRCHSEHLTLPHPRMHERRFVLKPLADIAPELSLPGIDKTSSQLLAELPEDEMLTLYRTNWSESGD